jgi:Mg2+-importing ATPase
LADPDRQALLQAARDSPDVLLARLNTTAEGLSALQARLRLERVGPNAIAMAAQRVIARNTCRDVGLEVEEVLIGSEVEAMDDDTLAQWVESTTILAKLSPLGHARILRLLRRQGHVVGFRGDGINDAAALREADIGISLDTAVDIAKESADIVLLLPSRHSLGPRGS